MPSHIEPRLDQLLSDESSRFVSSHPRSCALHKQAMKNFVYGVPMHWMVQSAAPHPLFMAAASGSHLQDVDGNDYADFCLGDTGAMFGHANPFIAAAIAEQAHKGCTAMLPTEDAIVVGQELQERFGLPFWEVAVSATDANRFAIRIARIMTGRNKILVFNGKYHGSVDETNVALIDGAMVPQPGIASNAVDYNSTTKIVEFNDIAAVQAALADRDVACVITEPVMTNVGMVMPAPGFHAALREATRETGTLLLIDETHTISTGPRGYIGEYKLEPDMFVLGKSIAGGIPVAVYGMTQEVAAAFRSSTRRENYRVNHFGFGGTLAANALTMHALRAALTQVMTQENYAHMFRLANKFRDGVAATIDRFAMPWHVTRIGARVEYMFSPDAPRSGGEAKKIRAPRLEAGIHLYLLNRGVLLTPFHSMALMCPQTSEADVDRHTAVFEECVRVLAGA